jgi:Acyltransferase family
MSTAQLAANRQSLAQMAAATPSTRDRYVDFLRAFSIAVVAFGHWLMASVFLVDRGFTGESALEQISGIWILTWALQVMPLFFFVGGFSNLVSWDAFTKRGGGYAEFLRNRVGRLMRPTAVFIAVLLPVGVALSFVPGPVGGVLEQIMEILARPLWFLGVYLMVVALAPVMLRVHRRYRLGALVSLAGAAAAIDVARIVYEIPVIGYLNFAFVWLFAHQLGFFYADGTMLRFSKRAFASLSAVAMGALILLTALGPYAPSMVGGRFEGVSNNDPPSICIIVLSCWLVSIAMLFRDRVSRWLAKDRPWKAVIAVNSTIMTIFLWHLAAMVVAVIALYPLGFPQPETGTATWWAVRPLWLAALTAFLVVFVAAFGRFERTGLLRQSSVPASARQPSTAAAIAGVGALVAGISGFAEAGFMGTGADAGTLELLNMGPAVNVGWLLLGGWLLRGSAAGTRTRA